MDHQDHERYYREKFEVRTHKVRSVFKPRWWQVRFRFRLWNSRRAHDKALAKLTPEGREMLDEMEKEKERRILFGDQARRDGWMKQVAPPRDEDRPKGLPKRKD